MFCKPRIKKIPFQHVHQQDLQEAGLSAGDVSLNGLNATASICAQRSDTLQVIQFAQDLALEEIEVETCGCLGKPQLPSPPSLECQQKPSLHCCDAA